MIHVLVTGSNGQLGSCIKDIAREYGNLNLIYTDYLDLDITDLSQLNAYFKSQPVHYCINCAAYTAVDKAESEEDKVYAINALGAKNLAIACKQHKATLIHVSTDFVFDGKSSKPYSEEDETLPISVYGASKLRGEQEITNTFNKYFIIRTSWLYSEHGNNFMKTMLRLAKTNDEINVVSDQVGTPTYAKDFAYLILNIINEGEKEYGIYHYSNGGVASWYDFAKAIFSLSEIPVKVNPISTKAYPTPAARPQYSVLNKEKAKTVFKLNIPLWKDSLEKAIMNIPK